MNEVFRDYSEIDIYNIYAPACLSNSTSSMAGDSNSDGPESFTKVDKYHHRFIIITLNLFHAKLFKLRENLVIAGEKLS